MEADDSSLRVLSLAQQHALSFLNNLDRAPVGATVDLKTLRARLNKSLAESGLPLEQVITELVADVEGGLLGSAGGRFFGWVISRGFSTYAALRQLGRAGIAELIERCCRHAHELVMGIGSLSGAEVLWEPTINQGLVRFLDPSPVATEQDHDRRTEEVIGAIVASGEAFFGGTTWRGKRAMRVSVCNWRTSTEDVRRSINSVARVLGENAT